MITFAITTTYVLKWELKTNSDYKFGDNGLCINTKTENVIRMILNGRSKGYCINGKFKSLNTLRSQLKKIEKDECPF